MDLYVLQLGHRQLHPSLQALVVRVTQFIGTPHVVQFMLLVSSPLLFRKLMAAIVLLAKIIGPRVDIAMASRRPQKETSQPHVLVNRQFNFTAKTRTSRIL